MKRILLRIILILGAIYLIYKFGQNDIIYNISFAEEAVKEEKRIPGNASGGDLKYNYHPGGNGLFALDLTCFIIGICAFYVGAEVFPSRVR